MPCTLHENTEKVSKTKPVSRQKCVSQFEAAEEQDPQVLLNDAAAVLGNQNDCVGSQDREVVIEEIPDDQCTNSSKLIFLTRIGQKINQ